MNRKGNYIYLNCAEWNLARLPKPVGCNLENLPPKADVPVPVCATETGIRELEGYILAERDRLYGKVDEQRLSPLAGERAEAPATYRRAYRVDCLATQVVRLAGFEPSGVGDLLAAEADAYLQQNS